jgi:hypothetical protein
MIVIRPRMALLLFSKCNTNDDDHYNDDHDNDDDDNDTNQVYS